MGSYLYWRAYLEAFGPTWKAWRIRLSENLRRLQTAEEYVQREHGALTLLVFTDLYGRTISGATFPADVKPEGWVKSKNQPYRERVCRYPSSSHPVGKEVREVFADHQPWDNATMLKNSGIKIEPVRRFEKPNGAGILVGPEIIDLEDRILISLPMDLDEDLPVLNEPLNFRYVEMTERDFNRAIRDFKANPQPEEVKWL